jgi:hypothetical protein
VCLLADGKQNLLAVEPEDPDRDGRQVEHDQTALQDDADLLEVARAVCLRRQPA